MREIVVVKILGGLGNQMFQYALGRKLALENQCALKLDVSVFKTYKVHGYELDRYNVQATQFSRIASFWMKVSKRLKGKSIVGTLARMNMYQESSLRFDWKVLNQKAPLFLEGYWQSENYFKDIRSELLKDFTLKNAPSEENQKWLQLMKTDQSVSLHIRRGDYVSNPNANQVHGVLPLSYYANAIAALKKKQDSLEYFVFSDDPEWVRENLKIDGTVHYVTNNVGAGYEDLRLMQNCRFNIIANSSFSWWAAWLNSHPQKAVFAPARWFSDPLMNANATDIVPQDWIKVPLT